MLKPAAGNNNTDACGKALRDLLFIAASPDNLDAFLRRAMAILCRPDALGPGAGLAVVLRLRKDLPLFTVAVNFTPPEQRLFSAAGRADPTLQKDLLSAAIQGGTAKGRLLARIEGPASRAGAAQLLEIAAKTISGRLAQESREKQLTLERDIADAISHLEELYLAFPALSLEEISRTVLDEARRLTGSSFGFAGYINPATGCLHVPTLTDKRLQAGETVFKEFKGLWGWVLKKKKPLLSNSAAADPRAGGSPVWSIKIERFAAAPAVSGKDLIGILALANPPQDYQPAALDAVKKLARVYALMLRHKLAERQQQADNAKYKAILDTSSDVIYNMGVDGKMLYVSRAAENFGYAPGEVVGRYFTEFIHPADRVRVKEAFLAAVKAGHNLLPVLAYRLLKKDGSYASVEQKNSVLPRAGASPIITGVVRDITAYRMTTEQLAESEVKYKTIFEKANAAIILADAATGIILDANKDAEKLTGRTRKELIGLNRLELHPPAEAAHYTVQFREHARKGLATLDEAEILRKDGSTAQVQISASKLTLGGRAVLQGIFHDVSERVRTEGKYKALVESTDTGYLILNAAGRVVDANEEYLRLTGRSRLREILGRRVTEWTAWYDRERNRREMENCLKKGHIRNLYIDYAGRRGKIIPIEVNATVVRTGASSQIVALCRDITGRKQAENRLRESEERYRLLFDNTADPAFIHGMDGKILAVNRAACQLYGYTKAEFSRMTAADIEIPEEATNIGRRIAQLLKTSHIRFETRHKRKNGSVITVDAASQAAAWEGKPATLSTCRDITGQKRVEAALRESENKYRALFETSRDALMILAPPHWKFTQANNATLKMFGVAKETSFLKLTPWALSPKTQPDGSRSPEKARRMLGTALRTGSNYFEWTHKRLDGTLFAAEVLLTRVYIGEKPVIQSSLRDISARKKTEAALQESEHFLDSVVGNIPNMVFVKDANDLAFVRLNKAAEALLGYSEKELLGTCDHDHFPRKEADFFTQMDRQVLAGKKILDIPEERIHTRSGEERILHTKKLPLADENGKPQYLLGISEDITERRRIEKLLTESEETLRLIFETATDAIFLKDTEGRYLKANKASADLFRLRAEELLGKTDAELFSPGPAAETMKDDAEVIRQGKTLFFNKERVLPSGKAYMSVVKTPLRGAGGEIIGVLGVVRDITGIKKMETELAAARASEALSKVARPMAHDFNNALAAISGYATMIDDELTEANPLKREIAQIIKAVTRAAELTSRLQDFARNPKLGEQESGKN